MNLPGTNITVYLRDSLHCENTGSELSQVSDELPIVSAGIEFEVHHIPNIVEEKLHSLSQNDDGQVQSQPLSNDEVQRDSNKEKLAQLRGDATVGDKLIVKRDVVSAKGVFELILEEVKKFFDLQDLGDFKADVIKFEQEIVEKIVLCEFGIESMNGEFSKAFRNKLFDLRENDEVFHISQLVTAIDFKNGELFDQTGDKFISRGSNNAFGPRARAFLLLEITLNHSPSSSLFRAL